MVNSELRMKALEDRVGRLEEDLVSCGIEKDKRMDSMHGDMINMHQDMGALKSTVEALTDEIRCAVKSLKEIAENTTNMKGIIDLYQRWVGFTWVMKNLGFWGAVTIAFVLGVVAAVVKFNA